MAKRSYTPEQRTQALELYRTDGPTAVQAQLGIPKATVTDWAQSSGVRTVRNEKTAAAVEAKRINWEDRRLDLAHEMGRLAAKALAAAERELDDRSMRDAQAAVTTCAILVDKAQVLTGEASVRVEHRHVDRLDVELEELARKLEAQAD
jgi:acetylornithine deacetylase/succinyl-diaminopimelate desuccinylase-like protein